MIKDKKIYKKYADKRAEKSPLAKNCLMAFVFGGGICCIGEGFYDLYRYFGLSEERAGAFVSVTLILIASILTGLGVFDNIAKIAGAGTLVPITGFSNAVTAPAIDTKSEGYILGVGANMFKIAGPVIAYGTLASVIYGIIYISVKSFTHA